MSAHAARVGASPFSNRDTLSGSQRIPATEESQLWLERGRAVIRQEASALSTLSATLDNDFLDVVTVLAKCSGRVIVCGIGKAGLIGQKFSATLSSTGTSSHFLHPAEAVHGDLGGVQSRDVVVFFSYSGETEEVNRLIGMLRCNSAAQSGTTDGFTVPTTIAVTKHKDSTLANHCDHTLPLGDHPEACTLGLAPSTSTTLMLAISDAIALVVSESKGFTAEQFAGYHPGGSLGRKLSRVTDVMRPLEECRVAFQGKTVREVLVDISRPGRRTGAIMLVDAKRTLTGIFTDSDLARLLEKQQDASLDRPVAEVMSRQFHTIDESQWLTSAVERMSAHKISELPVVDDEGRPRGLIDITDVVDMVKTSGSGSATGRTNSSTGARTDLKLRMQDRSGNATAPVASNSNASVDHGSAPKSGDAKLESGLPRILSLIKYRKEPE